MNLPPPLRLLGAPPSAKPKRLLRRNLRAIMGDGAAFSVMVGIGETYVPAFVLALGLGQVAAGLVATLPLLAGSVLQLATPWAVHRLGTYRRWVVCCATCQAISLMLMAAIALEKSMSGWWVFAAATMYWAAGMATGPAWNTWVEHLVPRSVRASFFAHRVRVSQLCTLLGLVVGGLLLRTGASGDALRTMFAVTFGTAAFARLISANLLASQSETRQAWTSVERAPKPRLEFLQRGPGMRLICYLWAVQVAVYLAGPYFTPFMLTKLELSYTQYMLLLGSAYFGKIVALPTFGAVAKRAGATVLLWFGGVAIVPVAAFWLISDSFYYLLGMQFVAGILWAAYELAVFLLFFETIPREQRISVLTWYNLGNSAAMVVGALLGAAAMTVMDDSIRAYLTLFLASSIARAMALVLLPGAPQRLRATGPLVLRTLAIRPSAGSIHGPILPSCDDAKESSAEPSQESSEAPVDHVPTPMRRAA